MPHLMGQREDRIQCPIKAHQHIRVNAVSAVGVRAASFSLVLIDVDPAVLKSCSQEIQILLS